MLPQLLSIEVQVVVVLAVLEVMQVLHLVLAVLELLLTHPGVLQLVLVIT
jgi:hypothetical protein